MISKYLPAIAAALFATVCSAMAGREYQATGPVLEVTDTKIIIEKDKEKWEFTRTQDLKVTGKIAVGAKVTVHYTMTAVSAEVKDSKESKEKSPEKKPDANPAKKAA